MRCSATRDSFCERGREIPSIEKGAQMGPLFVLQRTTGLRALGVGPPQDA